MKIVLKVHKVWDRVNLGLEDAEKNDIAIAVLFQAMPESLIMQVGNQETSKGIWKTIKTRHLGAERVKEERLQTLTAEFDTLKMAKNNLIDGFARKLSEIAAKSHLWVKTWRSQSW